MTSSARKVLVGLFCVFALVSAATVGVGSVAGQDVPPLPATYHGELTTADGEITDPVRIEAVADGEVQDTIITDSNGAIGGPTISDDKLEVQEPDESEVAFHVNGEPVTIVSVNGNSVNADSIPFESGDQEIVLEATAEQLAPAVDLSVTDAPATATPGDAVGVDIAVENLGDVATSQSIELTNFTGGVVDTTTVSVGIDETTETTLTWEIPSDAAGDGTITVRAGNTTATHELTIERVSPPPIADPGDGSSGGGGSTGGDGSTDSGDSGSGDDDDTADTVDEPSSPEDISATEQQTIESDAGFGLSQVRFTDATTVESVTWNSPDINGSVTATEYTTAPNETGAAPGGFISLSEITPPTEIRDRDATIEFTVPQDRLESVNATPEALRLFRFTDGEWVAVETALVETSDESVLLQTQAPGSSYFAVSATGTPTAALSVDPTAPDTNTTITFDGSGSTTPYGNITAYEWRIGDESTTGETVERRLTDPGNVTVELTVTNDAGATNTTTQSVSVSAVDTDSGSSSGTDSGSSSGTDSGSSSGNDSGGTDESIPGFTGAGTLVALLVILLGVRYSRIDN